MSLKIVTGGTTGTADGTLVSGGNPIVFTAIDTPIDVHIRADDDTYANPAQFVAVTTAGPAVGKGDIQISVDGGSTWKSWSDNPYSLVTGQGLSSTDVGDLNFPIKLRQHAASPPGDTSGSFDTDGTLTSATALGDVSGFTVTPSSTQNAVSWSAVTNRTSYQVDRATNSGFTTGVSLGVYTGTGTSFTDTGLTNGTTYYYRIKAVGTYRFKDSANFATGNGTPNSSTTSTFLAAAAGDGAIRKFGASWATLIASTANGDNAYDTATGHWGCQADPVNGSPFLCQRGYYPIDTSALPDGATISAASLFIYSYVAPGTGAGGSTANNSACVVASTQASTGALVVADYKEVGATLLAARVAFSAFPNGGWVEFVLNSTGIAAINKTGFTKLALRTGYDLDGVAPVTGISGGASKFSDESGTTFDPYLSVTYT